MDATPQARPAPLIYGYVWSARDQPERVADCQEALRQWSARRGWVLGAIFTDIGAPLDSADRIGFRGLLDALSLPNAAGMAVLDSGHLSPSANVVLEQVRQVRHLGAAVFVRDGGLPEAAAKLCQQQGQRTP
ncbi:hypothetical protein SAMN05192558_103201 [Actinokineospora alba]|uniref:Resolvase, N terminal domain n=1 Tax=Actinokineospora alba TaxID=504798 RepID=A0A1H0JTB4_9PSEU|nr:hypothetical protein [Actinokineospora alba]TDP68177.1 hypothetical protein C8E96_3741 [Actinokineospora alba]SDH93688.1 hypothetical protein SAMN05421871_102848 [Actinokineospora alba]SDO46780.1 hypothetical protein SAMN05192558_103201 [Actinokineospora alba]